MATPPFLSPADGSTRSAAAPVGVVLAGGASQRMGRDKAELALGGTSLAAGTATRLAQVCPQVLIADRGRSLVPGFRSVPDGPGQGPAAGLLGTAALVPGRPLLVLACDLPAVPSSLLADLAESASDLALPRWSGGIEPLCALYGPRALAALARRVEHGRFALHDLAEEKGLTLRWLEGDLLTRHGHPGQMFLNLNTPADLERWLASGS